YAKSLRRLTETAALTFDRSSVHCVTIRMADMIYILETASPTGVFRTRLRPGVSTIGRASDCEVLVPDQLVSGRHAQITLSDDGRLRVQDLGSRNGTYVNGVRRTEVEI